MAFFVHKESSMSNPSKTTRLNRSVVRHGERVREILWQDEVLEAPEAWQVSTEATLAVARAVVAAADADVALTVLRRTRAGMSDSAVPAPRPAPVYAPDYSAPVARSYRGALVSVALLLALLLGCAGAAGWLHAPRSAGAAPALTTPTVVPALGTHLPTGGSVRHFGAWARG